MSLQMVLATSGDRKSLHVDGKACETDQTLPFMRGPFPLDPFKIRRRCQCPKDSHVPPAEPEA